MTVATDTITATLLDPGGYGSGGYGSGAYGSAGYPLGQVEGTVTMDEGYAPHVQATLTLGIPDQTLLDLLDPRDARRILIQVSQAFPDSFIDPEARSFDLGLRERVIDHEAGTLTLTLASDEALLMDHVLVSDTPNISAGAYQSSLRNIIDNVVLDKIGAALEPGSADAPFNVYEDSTNLIPNPSLETNSTGWVGVGCSLSRNTPATFASGVYAMTLTGTGTADSYAHVGGDSGGVRLGLQEGKTYTVAATARITTALSGTAVSIPAFERAIVVHTKVGSAAYAYATSPQVANTAGNVERVSVTFTVPVGVSEAFVRLYLGRTAGQIQWDAVSLVENNGSAGVDYTDYFDGDTADTLDLAYMWTGTPHASTSTRTVLVDRSPDLLRWDPGEALWDFIQPLFQAAGFRLFCNEAREWHLVNGSEYIAPGSTQLAYGVQLTKAEEGISRDSGEWFDAAVVTYRWRDSDDVQQERIDFYAEPGFVHSRSFEIERPYPGAGFAEYVVRRSLGKGRTLRLAAMSRYSVTPSQILSVELPSTPTQVGVVSSVTWDLGEAVMEVQSRGITDTPPEAWILLIPGESWNDSPIGESWITEII